MIKLLNYCKKAKLVFTFLLTGVISLVCGVVVSLTAYAEENNLADGTLKGYSVTLNDGISLNCMVNLPEGAENATMTFTLDAYVDQESYETTISDWTEDGDNVKFIYSGVTPQHMNDDLVMTINYTLGGVNYYDTETTSVQSYLESLLNDASQTEKTKLVAANMLNYGAAAQIYVEHDTENLANANVGEYASEFEGVEDTYKMIMTDDLAQESATWQSAGLFFSDRVGLYFKYTTEVEGATVKASLGDGEEKVLPVQATEQANVYMVAYTNISVLDFDKAVNIQVFNGDTAISEKLSYSVNTYVYNKQGDDDAMAKLAKATYLYGTGAEHFNSTTHEYVFETFTRKDKYAVGEKFYQPFAKYNEKIVKTATCTVCGASHEVQSYEIDDTAMTLGQTEVGFTAVVDGQSVRGAIPVEVYDDRVRLEAETWFDTTPDTTQTHAVYNAVKTRSPGLELTANNSYVEFHYFAEKTQEVSVVLAFAYTNVLAKSGYQAAQVGNSQVNKFLQFSINGESIAIDNDVILYGGGANDGVARHSYTNTSTYIYLDNVYVNEGENVLRFTQKTGVGYTNVAAGTGASSLITMDALELFPVRGHSHDWQLIPRARRTMFVEGETFKNRFADYGDKLAKVVCSCGEEVETSATIDKTGALTTADTQIVFSAQYKGKKLSATLPIQVFASDAYTKIQAESLLESQPATGSENHWRNGGKNYNANTPNSKWNVVELVQPTGSASSQTYSMDVNIYSATEKTVYIVFGMTTTHSHEGGMSIDDVQVNDVVSFKVNGQAVEIGDDQVIWGIEQASKKADSKWRNESAFDLVLVKVTLHAGYNVINLKGIANSYKNVGGGSATTPAMVRFDYIELFETGE